MEEIKKYTYEEAFEASKEYFEGDELAAKVFVDKYALKDNEQNILEDTPVKMHKRLAKEFARIEKKYPNPMTEEEIFGLIDHFKYIVPAGSPMSAIGNPYQVQSTGNCFTIASPYDSYGGILYSDQQLAQLMKRRCGAGINISNLRPKGLLVKNAARTTNGIELWMERYSNTCREVAMEGRRGALIEILNIRHPDIEDFIDIKKDKNKITGSNISIQITEDFIKAVEKNENFELKWPVDSDNPAIKKTIKAKDLWDKIIKSNFEGSEPGLLYWDTSIKNSVSNDYGKIDKRFYDIGCNPCGEIIQGEDSCRLTSIVVKSFVKNPFTKDAYFDYSEFRKIASKAQRIMDDLVDIELELMKNILNKISSDPEPSYIKKIEKDLWRNFKEVCEKGRRTGLGITSIGDTFAYLGVRYGSDESIKITGEIYKNLALGAYESTVQMAKERKSFPLYSYNIEKNNKFLNNIWKNDKNLYNEYKKYGRRNIACLTTAPNGSIGILTQSTSGIEPVFQLSYKRRKKINPGDKNSKIDFIDDIGDSWQEFEVEHYGLKKWREITGKTEIKDSPYYQSTIENIDWMNGIDIQAAAQEWVCHSISRTCNLPKNITEDIISKIFMRAYYKKCKGITIYRQGTRSGVLIDSNTEEGSISKTIAPKRPEILNCDVHHVSVKKIPFFVIVGFLKNDVYEVFAGVNVSGDGEIVIPRTIDKGALKKMKRGRYDLYNINREDVIRINISKFIDEDQETITRLISSNLRHGCDVSFVVHQLEKTAGDLTGFSKAICRVLKKYIKDGELVRGEECPECHGELIREEGCIRCISCSFSKCG